MAASLPPDFPVGTVVGDFLFLREDGSDASTRPDPVDVFGRVRFTASVPTLQFTGAAGPALAVPLVFLGQIGTEGQLEAEDGSGVLELPATDSDLLNPRDWTWRADFDLKELSTGDKIEFPAFDFQVPVGSTVDLPTVMPLATSPGVITIQGPPGPQGNPGPVGAGVPTGGTALQYIRKNAANTTTEWATLTPESSAATPGTLAQRDSFGNLTAAQHVSTAAAPTHPSHTTRKDYVDAGLAAIAPLDGSRAAGTLAPEPTVSIVRKSLSGIDYNLITIHAGGTYRPGLVHKYLDITTAVGVAPTLAREHYPDIARDLAGATLINNSSGLIHNIEGTGEGKRVSLRGAQVVDGVARNPFPTDLYWTGYEACGVFADGKLKGYSAVRGDTVEGMVADGVINTISSFGPILVENGAARNLSDPFWNDANAIVSSLNFIGQKSNGDIILINAPGVSGVSGGTLANQTTIALAEGLEFAFSLDRGGSTQCWVGAVPLVASGDAGNRRLIADYLYTTAPIASPVTPQKIPLPLAANMSIQSTTYPPVFWIGADNVVRFSGQVKKTDGSLFGSGVDVISVLPEIARSAVNATGAILGYEGGDVHTRRYLYNVTDTSLKGLGATTASASYIDLTGVSWPL